MAIISIYNVYCKINGIENIEIIDALDKVLSCYVSGYEFSNAYKKGFFDPSTGQLRYWDGKKHFLSSRTMTFPIGLLKRVIAFLTKKEVNVILDDRRAIVKLGEPLKIHNFVPRPYQELAVETAIKNERGIIRLATGSGKTLVAAMIVARYNIPSCIFVISKGLLYQFRDELQKSLNIKIGIIGDGHCIIEKINICSVFTAVTAFNIKTKNLLFDGEDWDVDVANVSKEQKLQIKEMISNAQLTIFDEAQALATETIRSIFKAAKSCRFSFGMSGTDWISNNDDPNSKLYLESICSNRVFNLNASSLIEQKYLVPAKILFYSVPEWPEKLPDSYLAIYSQYVVKNELRNQIIVDVTKKLIQMGRKVLILVRHISHGKELAAKLYDVPLYFVSGAVGGLEREQVKEDFQNGIYKCLIASSVFDVGINIPELDGLILAGGGKSTIKSLQRIGRVIRTSENKKDAIIVDFLDNAKYLLQHSYARITAYESESQFRIKFPKDFDQSRIKRSRKIINKIS